MRLLYIFLIFFSFSVGSAEEDLRGALRGAEQRLTGEGEVDANEAETEAQGGCTTPECSGFVTATTVEAAELCRSTLPAHCQQIKDIKMTACYSDQTDWGQATGYSIWSCLVGIVSGGADLVTGTGKVLSGTYNLAFDEEFREEALNTASFFFEQFSDSEKFKELLSGPVLEQMDEFVGCLNYRGRWAYICEGGIQIIVPVYGYKTIKRFVGGRRNKQKLSIRQKFEQRKELQELLSGTGYVDISNLSGYQLGRLKPKDMARMNISNFTDNIGSFLSNRQLRGIPASKMNNLDIHVNHRTLERLSNDQFRVVMSNRSVKVSELPINVIENNIKRIPAKEISRLFQLDRISPKAFSQMSAPQIRNMSYRQVNDVTPEQVAKLSKRKKQTLKETREKRNKEAAEAKQRFEKEKAQREKERKAEERRQRRREQDQQRRQEEQQQQPEATTGEASGNTPASGSSTGGTTKSGPKKPKDSESPAEKPKDQKEQQQDSDNSTTDSGAVSGSGAGDSSSASTAGTAPPAPRARVRRNTSTRQRNLETRQRNLETQISKLEGQLKTERKAQSQFDLDKKAGKDVKMSDYYQHKANEAAINVRLLELSRDLGKLAGKK